jgi:hypothetical protein
MRALVPTLAFACILASWLVLCLTPRASASSGILSAYFDGLCIAPSAEAGGWLLNVTGISGTAEGRVEEVAALFPKEVDGRPRIGVALGVREPGLIIAFEERVNGIMSIINTPPPGLTVSPPEILHALTEVDTVVVGWAPVMGGTSSLNTTSFGPSCFFFLGAGTNAARGFAAVNLVALYGTEDDRQHVWGTEIGIQDVQLDEMIKVYSPVDPATWGRLKSMFSSR